MDQQRPEKDAIRKIINSADLETAIKLLEERKEKQEKELYETYHGFRAGLTPQSLLRKAFYGIKSSAPLRKDLFRIALGLGAGYLSKNVIISKRESFPKKILGDILQYGIAALVTAVPQGPDEQKQGLAGKMIVFLRKLIRR